MIYVEQYFPNNEPGKRFQLYKFDHIDHVIRWMKEQEMINRLYISDTKFEWTRKKLRYKHIKYPLK